MIYIYLSFNLSIPLSLSLSLYIYIYIYHRQFAQRSSRIPKLQTSTRHKILPTQTYRPELPATGASTPRPADRPRKLRRATIPAIAGAPCHRRVHHAPSGSRSQTTACHYIYQLFCADKISDPKITNIGAPKKMLPELLATGASTPALSGAPSHRRVQPRAQRIDRSPIRTPQLPVVSAVSTSHCAGKSLVYLVYLHGESRSRAITSMVPRRARSAVSRSRSAQPATARSSR